MTDTLQPSPQPGSQFLVYQTEDGKLKLDVRFEGETVWLTQQHMAELFQTSKQNVGQHLKSMPAEGERSRDSVVKNFFTTAADGKDYETRLHNLDTVSQSIGFLTQAGRKTQNRCPVSRGRTGASFSCCRICNNCRCRRELRGRTHRPGARGNCQGILVGSTGRQAFPCDAWWSSTTPMSSSRWDNASPASTRGNPPHSAEGELGRKDCVTQAFVDEL